MVQRSVLAAFSSSANLSHLSPPVLPVIVQGVMRLHTDQFDGSWTPVFHAAQHRKSSEEFWPVGLSIRQLCCVVCKEVPQVRSWAYTGGVRGGGRHSPMAGRVQQVARNTLVALTGS